MKKVVAGSILLSALTFAQEKPLDPCGSPKEFFSKYLLDQCYKGYFDAIIDARKKAEEAVKKAEEANKKADDALKKTGDLEKRVGRLEGIADDHEKRIRALEGRPVPKDGVGPYKWQLEEVGFVRFDFDRFNIKSAEAKKLDGMVDKLKADNREVLVVGFADKRGSSKYNFNLSMWRAQMVASYLAKGGVDIGRIRVASYGKEVADLLGKEYKDQRVVRVYLIR
ncbi:MAG: OmpA family protein [Acidobacteria bacterium]|jgi:peptidoglycan-associated lipoprotein|nr:MAG: OmpA family protein [Acidobacteriota bacterium]